MNYIESLLELIKNKKEISGDSEISLSLQEIADKWGRRPTHEVEDMFSLDRKKDLKIEGTFLNDIASAFQKLEKEGVIIFRYALRRWDFPGIIEDEDYRRSISDIRYLFSVQDTIVFEVIRDIDGYLEKIQNYKHKVTEKTVHRVKIEISISQEEGIYRSEKKRKLSYSVRGKRFRLIFSLKDGRKDGSLLAGLFTEKNLSQLSKEIGQINETFKNKLKVKTKLIVHIKTGGYKLNKDDYEIKFVS